MNGAEYLDSKKATRRKAGGFLLQCAGMKIVVLRGISGSGKSTWVREQAPEAFVVSADHFFIKDGEYRFDPTRLQEAHQACYRAFVEAVARKEPFIAVDNTNISVWEMAPYVVHGRVFGYDVEILTMDCSADAAVARKDLVPPEKVRQTERFLKEETLRMPPFMKAIYRTIPTC